MTPPKTSSIPSASVQAADPCLCAHQTRVSTTLLLGDEEGSIQIPPGLNICFFNCERRRWPSLTDLSAGRFKYPPSTSNKYLSTRLYRPKPLPSPADRENAPLAPPRCVKPCARVAKCPADRYLPVFAIFAGDILLIRSDCVPDNIAN